MFLFSTPVLIALSAACWYLVVASFASAFLPSVMRAVAFL